MNIEEKKAIERIDYIQDFIIENGQYNADVNDMEYFSKILNLIEKQKAELDKKNKIINAMENEILYGIYKFKNKKQIKEYFEKKVDEK